MEVASFENVRNQIGYCGIWCGSCVVGNGALMDLAGRYERLVEGYGLKEWGPQDFSFSEFLKGLVSLQTIPPCVGCLKGGGRENCEIRACAVAKGIVGCSECQDPAACEHRELLEKMRTGALRAGLKVMTERVDRRALLDRWTAELKNTWPCCVLFLKDEDRSSAASVKPSSGPP